MTKRELFDLELALIEATKVTTDKKFAYAVFRNLDKIEAETKTIAKTIEPFEKEKTETAKKLSVKDEAGNPKMIRQGEFSFFVFGSNQAKFDAELEELKIKHNFSSYEKMLEEEATVDFYMIKSDLVPEDLPNDIFRRIRSVVEFTEV